uniref:Uncharacterized protein n=1 Tax=Plectus sambesii TaxID=2011161 RepID=A0A914UGB1_9BILA
MFETVCKSSNCDMWALLLLQLMLYRVVLPDRDKLLFESCYDMLTTLMHCTLVEPVGAGAVEDAKPKYTVYFSIVKKLRKELSERLIEPDLRCLHQLIPLARVTIDIMAVEPYGTVPQSPQKLAKGQSSSALLAAPRATRYGLQFAEKQRMSPWDMIEGWSWTDQTSSGKKGWSWSWFQAVKVDAIPDSAQTQLQRLVHHEHYHWFRRPGLVGDDSPDDVFLEPPKTEAVEGPPMTPRIAPQPEAISHQQQVMGPGQPQMLHQRMPGQMAYQQGQMAPTGPIVSNMMGPPQMNHPQMVMQQQQQQPMAQFPHMEPPRTTSPRGAAARGGRQRKGSTTPGARTGRKNSKGSQQQQQIPPNQPYYAPVGGAPNQSSWPQQAAPALVPPVAANPPAQYVPGAQAMTQSGSGKERVHQMILQRTTNQGQQQQQHIQQQLQQQQHQQIHQRQQHQMMDVGPMQPQTQPIQPQMQPQPGQPGLQRPISIDQQRQMSQMQQQGLPYGHGGFPQQQGMPVDQQQQYQRQMSTQQSFEQQRSQQEMLMRQNSGSAMSGAMQPQFAQQRMPQAAPDQFQQQQYASQPTHHYR